MKLTAKKVEEIAEELRTTKERSSDKLAFDYIYNKYKHLFANYGQFVRLMDICSVFFSCRPDVEEIRRNTTYNYV